MLPPQRFGPVREVVQIHRPDPQLRAQVGGLAVPHAEETCGSGAAGGVAARGKNSRWPRGGSGSLGEGNEVNGDWGGA
ncbi:hypothetical protein PpBr36_00096 [Pyricularia pennisetigena]|uniref:hypothetical protein n=1 Tax=Pyricularia pennisetigena TaxID=1578925 RepID=UPI0011545D11|nr:hypothetical protein PpBr36_00096 [Pyricularia pennisetigena]TLS27992.1 hypothetical protein PpBr36_00096 [Pyricularia pennisetigena]